MEIKPVFAWYDLWVGLYYDRKGGWLYVLPVPCLGFKVRLRPKSPRRLASGEGG